MGVFRKRNRLIRPPIDLVYSTRLSCIDCKQNKLRKDEVGKFTQVYFDLLKHMRNLISFNNSECQSRNTVMFVSTSGKNLYKGQNPCIWSLFVNKFCVSFFIEIWLLEYTLACQFYSKMAVKTFVYILNRSEAPTLFLCILI